MCQSNCAGKNHAFDVIGSITMALGPMVLATILAVMCQKEQLVLPVEQVQ